MNMRKLDQSIFQTEFETKTHGKYKIIRDLGIINKRRFVRIKFLKTGYEKDVRYDAIINGNDIRDPYYPKIFNIGYTGKVKDIRNSHKRAYDKWIKMISRCYNRNDKDYKNYGAIGVTVDPRWHCFENYLNDIQNLSIIGYQSNFDILDYQVDKDYLQMNIPKEQRVYSKDTCVLINPKDNANLKLIDNSKFKVNNYFGVYKSYNRYYPTIIHNGIVYKLGIYENEIAAANAYNYYYKQLNSNNNILINTINNVPYMSYEEFSKYNKRKLICPVYKIK